VLTACAEDDPQQFIKEGQALFEKGDLKEAGVQFKNALQINPQLAEAYYGLALLAEKSKDMLSMKQNLLDTVRLDPKHFDAHVKLGFLQLNDIEKAKKHAEVALKLDPKNKTALLLDGRVLLSEGDNEGALSRFNQILAKDPLNVDAIWSQAYAFLMDKRYGDALASINRGLKDHPESLEMGMLKIKLYKEQKMGDEVNHTYEELVALHPEDKTLRYARLEMLARTSKQVEPVEKALRDALAKDSSDLTLQLALVDMLERNNVDLAEQQLQEFIQASPGDVSLIKRLAGFYIGHENHSKAEELLKQIVDKDPNGNDGLIAKVRLAELAVVQKDKIKAERFVGEVLVVDTANSSALLLRSSFRLEAKDPDGAISDLRIVLRDKPDSEQAMVRMAQAYLLKGEPEIAESNWRKALEVNPANMEAIMPLVAARLKRGDIERAEDLIVKGIKINSNNPVLVEMLAKILILKKDWVGAETAINDLTKYPQYGIVAQMLTGVMLENQGLYRKAIDVYKAVLLEKPDSETALMSLVQSYKEVKRPEEFVGFLKSFIEKNPGNIHSYNLLAQAYATDKKWVQAEKVLQKALKQEPKSTFTYKLLGAVMLSKGEHAEALGVYEQGLRVMPDNPELMLALAKYYKEVQAFNKAITSYEALLNKFPSVDEAANDLADLLVNTSNDPASLKRAMALVERFKESNNPYAQDTYGWVLFKAGELDQAVSVLKQSAKAVPENADIRYHLGEALYAVRDYSSSKVELEKYLSLAKGNKVFSGIDRAKLLLKEISGAARSEG